MAEKRVERHSRVIREDLPKIYDHIRKDDPSAAERLLDAIELTIKLISKQPEAGVRYHTRSRRLQNLRMLPVSSFSNYLIFVFENASRCRAEGLI